MGVAAAVLPQVGDVVVEDGRGAPDGRVDDAAGPLGPTPGADDLRAGAVVAVAAAHAPVSFGVVASLPHSDQLPS